MDLLDGMSMRKSGIASAVPGSLTISGKAEGIWYAEFCEDHNHFKRLGGGGQEKAQDHGQL